MQCAEVGAFRRCLRGSKEAAVVRVCLNCIQLLSPNTTSYLQSSRFPPGKPYTKTNPNVFQPL